MVGSRYTNNGKKLTRFTRYRSLGKDANSNCFPSRVSNSSDNSDDCRDFQNGSKKEVRRGLEKRYSGWIKGYDFSSINTKLISSFNLLLCRFNSIFQFSKASSPRSIRSIVQKVAPYAVLATIPIAIFSFGIETAHANPLTDFFFPDVGKSIETANNTVNNVDQSIKKVASWFDDPFGFQKGIENLETLYQKDGNIEVLNEIKAWGMQNEGAPEWVRKMIIWAFAWMVRGSQTLLYSVFTNLFWLLTKVLLYIPSFIFNGAFIGKTVIGFTVISFIATLVWSAVQGIKRMLFKKYTPITKIAKRFPIALLASASIPYVSSKVADFVNKITSTIVNVSIGQIEHVNSGSFTIHAISFMPLSILLMIGFFLVLIGLIRPLFLQNGKRWFDFLLLILTSPFALSAYIFDDTQKYFKAWWNKVKDSFLIQIFNAFILSIMGLIIFATPAPESFADMATKTLLMIGSLYYLAFPPSIIGKLKMNEDGLDTMYDKSKKEIKKNVKGMKEGYIAKGLGTMSLLGKKLFKK